MTGVSVTVRVPATGFRANGGATCTLTGTGFTTTRINGVTYVSTGTIDAINFFGGVNYRCAFADLALSAATLVTFGTDTMTGGSEADVFLFAVGSTALLAKGTITDFQTGLDDISIAGIGLTFVTGRSLARTRSAMIPASRNCRSTGTATGPRMSGLT